LTTTYMRKRGPRRRIGVSVGVNPDDSMGRFGVAVGAEWVDQSDRP